MPLVGTPPNSREATDPKRFTEGLQLQKYLLLPSPTDVCSYGATLGINGMPQPLRLGLLAHITPPLVERRGQSVTLCQFVSATQFHLHLLRTYLPQHRRLSLKWLRVLGTTETPHIDQGVRHQLHPIMALLDVLEPEQ